MKLSRERVYELMCLHASDRWQPIDNGVSIASVVKDAFSELLDETDFVGDRSFSFRAVTDLVETHVNALQDMGLVKKSPIVVHSPAVPSFIDTVWIVKTPQQIAKERLNDR